MCMFIYDVSVTKLIVLKEWGGSMIEESEGWTEGKEGEWMRLEAR
jgi:hypothetical protein